MDKTIVCDKCGCEDCGVSEVRPESEKISMKDFATRGKSPYQMDSWQSDMQRVKTWVISCPECKHSIEYKEYPDRPAPFYAMG